jgi:acyl-CoA synthetase (AMP-forming)/AMP-acid ligase II
VNIVDPILVQCRYQPDAPALCVPGTQHAIIAYGQLGKLVNNIARHVGRVGLKPGDTVILYVADKIGHTLLLLGLAKAGIVTISARGYELPPMVKVDALIADVSTGLPAGKRIIRADASWMEGDGSPPAGGVSAPGADAVARIVLTSGTTGQPKGVAYTHRVVAERIARFDYLTGNVLPAVLRNCLSLGFSTSLGYLHLIYTLQRGGLAVLAGASSEELVGAAESYQAETWIGLAGSLAHLVQYFEQSRDRRCNFRALLCAGSLLPKALSDRVRLRMCPNLICIYGSTEMGMVATGPSHAIADIPGAVGFLTPSTRVETVDEADRPLPAGTEGVVRIGTPYGVTEYAGDPEETAKTFRDGWFYPGDLGSVTAENMLIITGRQKTLLNIGGDKIAPEAIEGTLMSFAGVDQAGVIAVVDEFGLNQVWAAVVWNGEVRDAELHSYCQGKLPTPFVPHRFVRIDRVPLNEMGKIDRPRLTELLRSSPA